MSCRKKIWWIFSLGTTRKSVLAYPPQPYSMALRFSSPFGRNSNRLVYGKGIGTHRLRAGFEAGFFEVFEVFGFDFGRFAFGLSVEFERPAFFSFGASSAIGK